MSAFPLILASPFIVAAVLVGSSATATAPHYERFRPTARQFEALESAEFIRRVDASGGVTINLRNCAAAEYERRDARLNVAYRAARRRLPSQAARDRLRSLERRWLATRWDQCERDGRELEGGTLWLIFMDACGLAEVSRRILWLERYGRRR